MAESNTVTLHLQDIRELFAAPEFNPYDDPERLEVSGLDYLVEYLNKEGIRNIDRLKTTIYLPKEAITPGIEEKTRQALIPYCKRKIAQYDSTIQATRREGRRTLPYGLIVAFAVAVVLFVLSTLLSFSSTLHSLLVSAYVIIAWVSIWHPVEAIFYDWITDWNQKHIYLKLIEMELAIQPEA